ncbi:PLCB2 family protein [Megaselia abdita]
MSNGTYVSTGPVEVLKALQDGEKFIKWDEESGIGTPVTMRIDPKGFYLYWIDQNNEMDLLDIALIRDVRTGQYAKKPRDPKLRQIVTMGSQDTLEEKTVTVVHGSDFVNVFFVNFCCTKKDIAKVWADSIMKLSYSLNQLNASSTMYLQKAHTKLCLQVDKSGKIPVKNIIKLFTQNKDDKKRVEKALDASGLPSAKIDVLPLSKFQFEDFYNLYKTVTQRSEVEKIFDEIVGSSKRKCMTTTQLVDFLNKSQRDPRLNEILYPYVDPKRAKEVIQEYEPNKFNVQKGQLSVDGFLKYLMSDDNPIMAQSKIELCDSMDQPLSHYFINSSHNTYLTGHQLTGKSSVEIYRQCLLAGCRCVELDFWNGRTEEPIIVHGYTFVPEILAKEVLEAIAECAFKTSDYPVILSFENHCNPRQQAKIANYCREFFGDMLLEKPMDSHPLEPNVGLPPPSMLKRKIIIKNKKKHHHHHHKKGKTQPKLMSTNSVDVNKQLQQQQQLQHQQGQDETNGNGEVSNHAPPLQQIRQSSKDSTGSSDSENSSSDDESLPSSTPNPPVSGTVQPPPEKAQKESEAGAEISALVNYVQPVHFSTFENAEKKGKCYEMSSFDEKQATTLLKERPIEFVNYNKHQLSRVYPAGTRFDSSNFMPQLFWNAGCQLVALNFQTLDLAMQLNCGIFDYNQRCGYILKPEFMRRNDRRLDPFAESTVDGIIAGYVSITVLSGQFLTDKRVGTYVEIDMFGLPADTVRKKFRTKLVRDNGINPIYDEDAFVFKKIVLPELASIRVAAYEESGKLIGHRVLPVIGLCPGYRHLSLRNELGQPLGLASLFMHVVVKDYVPDDLSNFAEALANPIKYQSELEKRDKQLAVLTDDTEPIQEDDVTNSCPKKELRPVDSIVNSPKHRASITAAASMSIEGNIDGDGGGANGAVGGVAISNSSDTTPNIGTINQHSLDQGATTSVRQGEVVVQSSLDIEEVTAEPLDKILDNKLVKEKRLEFEKKLESLRKKHDKEKIKVTAAQQRSSSGGSDASMKKPKFSMPNKLVKRLSSKNLESTIEVPPCAVDLGESSEDSNDKSNTLRSNSERLLAVCREHSRSFRELQEKYHEQIYSSADKVMKASQATKNKQLKASYERVTHEVMQQLETARRNEVKILVSKYKDKDELERMKREVASLIVNRGVQEKRRLQETFSKRNEELTKQHEAVKNALSDQRQKARQILEKDTQTCVSGNGFLVLFHSTYGSSSRNSTNNIPVDVAL